MPRVFGGCLGVEPVIGPDGVSVRCHAIVVKGNTSVAVVECLEWSK